MKIIAPDFYKTFHCLAGACPDSCCRQGWQIPIDDQHLQYYRSLPGKLGETVRNSLSQSGDDTVWAMDNGVCRLLDENGLCTLAKTHGEEALCHLCHTHPRFVEEYGGTREIHLSLQCPEAARLTLERESPITFETTFSDESVTAPNTIDPEEYFALLTARKFALALVQARHLPIADRMALLLQYGRRMQNLLDQKKYKLCKPLSKQFCHPIFRNRQLNGLNRLRNRGTSFLPEVALMRSLEHLTEEFPQVLHRAVFTAKDSDGFDRDNALRMEFLLTAYLSHYIPKAVNDGRLDTKIRLAVLLTLTVRRFCVCTGREHGEDVAHFAGLLAKEVEHSPENMEKIYTALEQPGWHEHLAAQISRKGARHAI